MSTPEKSFVFVTRMFSGLYESIRQNEWKPTGIPAFVKLIESIAGKHRLIWIISCKTNTESEIINHRYTRWQINNIDMHIFPYKGKKICASKSSKIYAIIDHLGLIWTDACLILNCLRITRLDKNHIFYFDRADILIAAFVKWFSNAKVVIRILGVYPNQKQVATTFIAKIKNPLIYLSYKTRYDLAVGTQDGSGIEFFMEKLLNAATPVRIMLNGVKKFGIDVEKHKFKADSVINLLFVGKLIPEKGILELIDALKVLKETNRNFRVKILGKGYLEPILQKMIAEYGLEDHVGLVGSVSQKDVYQYYQRADIYISLNKFGNLSNTVLEAMSAGKCILILNKDDKHHTDMFTQNKIPSDVVIRVDRKNIVDDLAAKLSMICNNPLLIQTYSSKMARFKAGFLWSWEDRIQAETQILENLAKTD